MNAGHTPGPWHAHFVSAVAEESDGDYGTATGITTATEPEFLRDGARGDLLAWIPHDQNHAANARLIAAAPDLLAALELVDIGSQPDDVQWYVRRALRRARLGEGADG